MIVPKIGTAEATAPTAAAATVSGRYTSPKVTTAAGRRR